MAYGYEGQNPPHNNGDGPKMPDKVRKYKELIDYINKKKKRIERLKTNVELMIDSANKMVKKDEKIERLIAYWKNELPNLSSSLEELDTLLGQYESRVIRYYGEDGQELISEKTYLSYWNKLWQIRPDAEDPDNVLYNFEYLQERIRTRELQTELIRLRLSNLGLLSDYSKDISDLLCEDIEYPTYEWKEGLEKLKDYNSRLKRLIDLINNNLPKIIGKAAKKQIIELVASCMGFFDSVDIYYELLSFCEISEELLTQDDVELLREKLIRLLDNQSVLNEIKQFHDKINSRQSHGSRGRK